MKQGGVGCAVVTILLVVGVMAEPHCASAQAHDAQRDGRMGVPPPAPRPVPPPNTPQFNVVPRPPIASRPFPHRPFAPSVVGVPVYVPYPVPPDPGEAFQQPAAYDPGVFYPTTADTTLVSPPPAPPSVIDYPTGRFELRGDGAATPYTWVWIPKPPPAPPAASPAPSVSAARPGPSAASDEIYRFTDDQGVVHWTDQWDSIPDRYRRQAKRLPL
ncbi:MAG TPA: DUF4124 domain-containing protein [Candidatus Methylomirabilis sp.]|nr:DUF4124 domain-containing protein [Candidatus Methylomirabilis sp.]